jgi:type II secretory pathway component PulL
MRTAAFFDLKDQPLLYIFDNSGRAYSKVEVLDVPVGPEYEIKIERLPHDIEEACISVSLDMLSFRTVELPFSDIKKVREVLPFELDNLLLKGSGDVVFDAHLLGEQEGKYKFLIVFIRKDVLKKLLDAFRQKGIDPRVITCIDLVAGFDAFTSENKIRDMLINETRDSVRPEVRIDIAAKEMAAPAINLRRDEFAYTGDTDKVKKQLGRTAALAACLILLLLSDLVLNTVAMKKESSALRDEMRKTYVGLFPGEKKISSEIYQLKAHIKELKDKENLLSGISPLQILDYLAGNGRPGLSFNEIIMERSHIVMKGDCRSLSDVQALKDMMTGFFGSVAISDTKPLSQGKTAFTITAK